MTDEWKDRILFGLLALLLGGGSLETWLVERPQAKTLQQVESTQEIKWIDIIERLDRIEERLQNNE